jgi:hypothetical protein
MSEMTGTRRKTDRLPGGGVAPDSARLWAGRGSGKPCEFCGEAIPAEDVQYDLEVTEQLASATQALCGQSLSFHLKCYDQWRAGLGSDVG